MRIERSFPYSGPLLPVFERAIQILASQEFVVSEETSSSLTFDAPLENRSSPPSRPFAGGSRLCLEQRGETLFLSTEVLGSKSSLGMKIFAGILLFIMAIPTTGMVFAVCGAKVGLIAGDALYVYFLYLYAQHLKDESCKAHETGDFDHLLTNLTASQSTPHSPFLALPIQDPEERCAFCHDGFDGKPLVLCPGCQTRVHMECWTEFGSCPSLGCANAQAKNQPSPRAKTQ